MLATLARVFRKRDASQLHTLSHERLYEVIGGFSKTDILAAYAHDRWQRNALLNFWEYATGKVELDSYPWNISLPIADVCNARCTFCNAWLRGEGLMKPEDLDRFREVLPYAKYLGIQGHGEPLANPQISEILAVLRTLLDKRCWSYIITNGVYLAGKLDLLRAAQVKTFNVSLNATTPKTHNVVMGLGENALPPILETIKEIVRLGDATTISLVLTRDNLHEAADFVRLGNELGVSAIYVRSLMPQRGHIPPPGLNYHLLPAYTHPDFAKHRADLLAAINASKVKAEAFPDTWETPIFSPDVQEKIDTGKVVVISRADAIKDKGVRGLLRGQMTEVVGEGQFASEVACDGENPYNRKPRFDCRFIYHNLICNEITFRANPCCYMADVPGHRSLVIGTGPFMRYWNSPAFVTLRKRLKEGPLYNECKACPMQG